MITASCFLYIVLTILYCLYTGDLRTLMYLVGQCTILMFVVALCGFILRPRPLAEVERLFILFSLCLTAGRAIYTVVCVFYGRSWVLYNTDVFGMLSAFCFLVLIVYVALKSNSLTKL